MVITRSFTPSRQLTASHSEASNLATLSSASSSSNTRHCSVPPETPRTQPLVDPSSSTIPRPPNSWILYHSFKIEQLKKAQATATTVSDERTGLHCGRSTNPSPAKGLLTAQALAALAEAQPTSLMPACNTAVDQHMEARSSSPAPSLTTDFTALSSIPPSALGHFDGSSGSNLSMSTVLAQLWKTESDELKESFRKLAKEKEEEHMRRYPDYKYQPKETAKSRSAREKRKRSSRTHATRSTAPESKLPSSSKRLKRRDRANELPRTPTAPRTSATPPCSPTRRRLKLHPGDESGHLDPALMAPTTSAPSIKSSALPETSAACGPVGVAQESKDDVEMINESQPAFEDSMGALMTDPALALSPSSWADKNANLLSAHSKPEDQHWVSDFSYTANSTLPAVPWANSEAYLLAEPEVTFSYFGVGTTAQQAGHANVIDRAIFRDGAMNEDPCFRLDPCQTLESLDCDWSRESGQNKDSPALATTGLPLTAGTTRCEVDAADNGQFTAENFLFAERLLQELSNSPVPPAGTTLSTDMACGPSQGHTAPQLQSVEHRPYRLCARLPYRKNQQTDCSSEAPLQMGPSTEGHCSTMDSALLASPSCAPKRGALGNLDVHPLRSVAAHARLPALEAARAATLPQEAPSHSKPSGNGEIDSCSQESAMTKLPTTRSFKLGSGHAYAPKESTSTARATDAPLLFHLNGTFTEEELLDLLAEKRTRRREIRARAATRTSVEAET